MSVIAWTQLINRGAIPKDFRVLPTNIILVRHAESEGNVNSVSVCDLSALCFVRDAVDCLRSVFMSVYNERNTLMFLQATYSFTPDSQVSLTERGRQQAKEAGQKIRALLEAEGRGNERLFFYTSPYRRSLETYENIAAAVSVLLACVGWSDLSLLHDLCCKTIGTAVCCGMLCVHSCVRLPYLDAHLQERARRFHPSYHSHSRAV